MRMLLKQVSRYALVGLFGSLINIVAYNLIYVNFPGTAWIEIYTYLIAYLLNYFLNLKYTFENFYHPEKVSLKSLLLNFTFVVIPTFLTYIITFNYLVPYTNHNLALAVAIFMNFFVGFIANRIFFSSGYK